MHTSQGRAVGAVNLRNLALVLFILRSNGAIWFNEIHRTSSSYGMRDRNVLSRNLKAARRRRMARRFSEGKGRKSVYEITDRGKSYLNRYTQGLNERNIKASVKQLHPKLPKGFHMAPLGMSHFSETYRRTNKGMKPVYSH